MPAWMIPAAFELGKTALDYWNARKQRTSRFQDTAYGKHLSKVSREGKYSPAMRRTVLSQVGARSGNIAQQQRAGTRGYLESRGMGSSIAGARLLNEPGRDVMREVSGTTKRLTIENEASKAYAAERLAMGKTSSAERRKAETAQMTSSLVSGLASTGMTGLSGYLQSRKPEFNVPENFGDMSPPDVFEWAKANGIDYETAMKLWEDSLAASLAGSPMAGPPMAGAPDGLSGAPGAPIDRSYDNLKWGYDSAAAKTVGRRKKFEKYPVQ